VRILVVGAGAMGSFLGGLLANRNDVTLVSRRPHADSIRRSGLRITGKTHAIARPRVVTSLRTPQQADLVLIATKSYDTDAAVDSVRPLARRALFLTLQNGLDNPAAIARRASRVVAGTTGIGVTFLRPGEVRHAGVGDTVVGSYAGATADDAVLVRDLLVEAGIPTEVSADIHRDLWLKVIVNCAINPLTAITRLKNGAIARIPWLGEAAASVCREAAAVARAVGLEIDDNEAVLRMLTVARRTRENRSSMLQDVEARRRTEIDAINGAVVREAAHRKIAAPVNAALHALVRGIEESWRVTDRGGVRESI